MLRAFTFISCLCFSLSLALDVPCAEKLVGGSCLFDEECYGVNTICRDGRCACPTNFEAYDVNSKVTVCRPAPDSEGAECQTDCKPPWICRDGKCQCWQGKVENGVCTVPCPPGTELRGSSCEKSAHFGQLCATDRECVDPLNICQLGRCVCAPGTTTIGNRCEAFCPDGQRMQQSCRRLFTNDIDMLDHADSTDSCPTGYQCVTYGRPFIGHCCRVSCPYGNPVGLSCDAGTTASQRCRPLTHYCHKFGSPGYKTSICCPRPCLEPTPLLIDGQCMPLSHLDDTCTTHEQCEGGTNMHCVAGRCKCILGFLEYTGGRFPTCVKSCTDTQISVHNQCLDVVNLEERCVCSAQCPANADCYYGQCQCRCGYKETLFLGTRRCSNPDDPLNFSQLITGVERFFGGAGSTSAVTGLRSC